MTINAGVWLPDIEFMRESTGLNVINRFIPYVGHSIDISRKNACLYRGKNLGFVFSFRGSVSIQARIFLFKYLNKNKFHGGD